VNRRTHIVRMIVPNPHGLLSLRPQRSAEQIGHTEENRRLFDLIEAGKSWCLGVMRALTLDQRMQSLDRGLAALDRNK
jgi:ABC-type taurine transport system ATPase subunit